MPVPKKLLEILACPKCKGNVHERGMFLACGRCRLAYPVLDKTIPDMLIEEAWALEKAKKAGFRHEIKL